MNQLVFPRLKSDYYYQILDGSRGMVNIVLVLVSLVGIMYFCMYIYFNE